MDDEPDYTSEYSWLVPPLPKLPKSPLSLLPLPAAAAAVRAKLPNLPNLPSLPALSLNNSLNNSLVSSHENSSQQQQRRPHTGGPKRPPPLRSVPPPFLQARRCSALYPLPSSPSNDVSNDAPPLYPLPSDLLPQILSYLSPSTVLSLSLISKSFYTLSRSPLYWYSYTLTLWSLPSPQYRDLSSPPLPSKYLQNGQSVNLPNLLRYTLPHPSKLSDSYFTGNASVFERDDEGVRYKGNIGVGDRCVRSDCSFPETLKVNGGGGSFKERVNEILFGRGGKGRTPFVYPWKVRENL
eukprot:CAMPEP_0182495124 /NCGR_PEP_ID=MMETSP1321-20130603/3931_1 /TAXON_ID=91990 /ORGANISM="Bolidomonas sp., Strain RCC1657" /LENGTH=294 /DNA_ID=CAMNT_0024698403 /DNA_START=234 /DNA_END=1115 /DNA_ORIENTATION=-